MRQVRRERIGRNCDRVGICRVPRRDMANRDLVAAAEVAAELLGLESAKRVPRRVAAERIRGADDCDARRIAADQARTEEAATIRRLLESTEIESDHLTCQIPFENTAEWFDGADERLALGSTRDDAVEGFADRLTEQRLRRRALRVASSELRHTWSGMPVEPRDSSTPDSRV